MSVDAEVKQWRGSGVKEDERLRAIARRTVRQLMGSQARGSSHKRGEAADTIADELVQTLWEGVGKGTYRIARGRRGGLRIVGDSDHSVTASWKIRQLYLNLYEAEATDATRSRDVIEEAATIDGAKWHQAQNEDDEADDAGGEWESPYREPPDEREAIDTYSAIHDSLPEKYRRMFRRMAAGATRAEIAREIGSASTVDAHQAAIMQHIGAHEEAARALAVCRDLEHTGKAARKRDMLPRSASVYYVGVNPGATHVMLERGTMDGIGVTREDVFYVLEGGSVRAVRERCADRLNRGSRSTARGLPPPRG